MARSARQPRAVKRQSSAFEEGALALGGMISRNPVLVGGSTAFLVTLFYVSANALWY
ncbi:MAG: peptidoglycan-binding protein, partial [Mesorhizobium sp.]